MDVKSCERSQHHPVLVNKALIDHSRKIHRFHVISMDYAEIRCRFIPLEPGWQTRVTAFIRYCLFWVINWWPHNVCPCCSSHWKMSYVSSIKYPLNSYFFSPNFSKCQMSSPPVSSWFARNSDASTCSCDFGSCSSVFSLSADVPEYRRSGSHELARHLRIACHSRTGQVGFRSVKSLGSPSLSKLASIGNLQEKGMGIPLLRPALNGQ